MIRWVPPGPVAARFVASNGDGPLPIDIILGPVGSGKTVSCVVRLLRHAMEAPKSVRDGIRRTKFAIVRNTGPMLDTTTIPTVLQWIPEHVRELSLSPPRALRLRFDDVDSTWLFLPLERPDDVRRLLSLDLTGAWINELREIPREIVTQLRRRCGRFPPVSDLRRSDSDPVRDRWTGIICDSNVPAQSDHWLCHWVGLSEPPDHLPPAEAALLRRPEGVSVFLQPPAVIPVRDGSGEVVAFDLNPDAENLSNLRDGYYRAQISGSSLSEILVMLACEPADGHVGRPVHPSFRRNLHVMETDDDLDPGRPIFLGADFGRDPAVVAGQLDREGRLLILREWVGRNVSPARHAARVVSDLRSFAPRARVMGWGDPSGSHRTGGDDRDVFWHVRSVGLDLYPAPSQSSELRRHALESRLTRLISGVPAIRISRRCRALIAGLSGGFRFSDRNPDAVLKNEHSHVCEALEYLVLGLDRRGAMRRHGAIISDHARRFDPLAALDRPPLRAMPRNFAPEPF